MILYQVCLTVKPEARSSFAEWLRRHIVDMLEIPGFIKADLAISDQHDVDTAQRQPSPNSDENRGGALVTHEGRRTDYQVTYWVDSEAHLDAYFNEYADKMRQEGLERYSGEFSAHRNVFSSIESFENP